MAEDETDSYADTDYTTTTAIPTDKTPWNTINLQQNNSNNME
jgi:hypothetical protein